MSWDSHTKADRVLEGKTNTHCQSEANKSISVISIEYCELSYDSPRKKTFR